MTKDFSPKKIKYTISEHLYKIRLKVKYAITGHLYNIITIPISI